MKFSINGDISICDDKAFVVQHATHHRYEVIGKLILQESEDQVIQQDGIKGVLHVYKASIYGLTIVNPPANIRR